MTRRNHSSRALERRTLAVVRALLPTVTAEGLREGELVRWASPPWACAIRTSVGASRIELRRGHLLLQATWRDAGGIRVLHFVPGRWDDELVDDLALLREAA